MLKDFIKKDKFRIQIYYCKGYYDNIFIGDMILNSEQFQKINKIFIATQYHLIWEKLHI
jgi:hypothetical protein